MDGVFQDEHGDFPAGSYIRNPPESSHTPRSAPGCTIFVKLWQFELSDRTHSRIDTNKMRFVAATDHDGVEVLPLFSDAREDVVVERWAPGVEVALAPDDGVELLVLEGGFTDAGEAFSAQSWLRLPRGVGANVTTGPDGARVWIKRGHLAEAPQAPSAG